MASGRLLAGGQEYPGQLQDLSPAGARLLCGGVPAVAAAELQIEKEGWQLRLPVEILHAGVKETRLAFLPGDTEQAEALDRLCRGETPASIPPGNGDFTFPGVIMIERVSNDWEPPTSSPAIHEWTPASGPLPAAGEDEPLTAWRRLPTITVVPRLPPLPEEAPAASTATGPAATVGPEEPAAATQGTAQPGESGLPPAAAPENPPAPPAPAPRPARADATGQPPERRYDERQERSIPVTFDNLTELIKEFTHNISFGGLFTYTTQPRQQGEEVAVTLIHPVHGGRLTLLGRVAHAAAAPSADPASGRPRYGVGVQFRLPKDELQRLLSDFIGSHQQPRRPLAEVVAEAERLLALDPGNYHQLLGVASTAGVGEIRRAYFALVDRFHPDRFFGQVPAAQQARLDELFRRLTEAYETLTR